MNCIFAIRRLLAILMIAGLVLAPLSRPVMAGMPADAPMQAMAGHVMDEMSAMADDVAEMPCCPSKAPAPVDCDKCVTMAGCMSIFLTGMPTAIVLPLPVASDRVALLTNDFRRDGLGHPPPEHPPRILV
ncbi:MAG: hypothetical protein HXX15_14760 [Rhodopseudomonas sp.]|uniref:hypothetical protein n=1 Tax=Rhodopseudomonas sp. TaxID=1078 RepID=UPI0017A6B5A3|nr:hypothetical protein [Rhodopseudomonas sp.]NVN87338.1 hypothetical protein [Rhodopseudomonas sp.]